MATLALITGSGLLVFTPAPLKRPFAASLPIKGEPSIVS